MSPPHTSELCNDKYATCRYLLEHGVAAAASWLPADVPADAAFPLFIKPRRGRGSVGAYHVRQRRELDFFVDYVPDPVVQEYLDGPEFTIDMLCDFWASRCPSCRASASSSAPGSSIAAGPSTTRR